MALDANGIPQNSGSQGGEGEGEQKLYGGKWKTLEEAVDKGYSGLEKGYHETREEIGSLRRLIEERIPERQEAYNSERYVARSEPAADDKETANRAILSEFYSDPQGFKNRLKRETLDEIEHGKRRADEANQAYQAWATENPDVSAEIPLIDFYVRQQPTSLSPRERLNRATPAIREQLKRLRAPQAATAPGPNDHVENPGGQRQAAPAPQAPASGESNLAAYIAERNRMRKPQIRRG